jgi:hypothetical protein
MSSGALSAVSSRMSMNCERPSARSDLIVRRDCDAPRARAQRVRIRSVLPRRCGCRRRPSCRPACRARDTPSRTDHRRRRRTRGAPGRSRDGARDCPQAHRSLCERDVDEETISSERKGDRRSANERTDWSLSAPLRCLTSSRMVQRARTRAEASERSKDPPLTLESRASSTTARTPVRSALVAS